MVIGLKNAAKLYCVFILFAYLSVMVGVIIGYLPLTTYVTFLTLPIAFKAIKGVMANYGNINLLIPSMEENVKLVLSMTSLTSLGIIVEVLL